MTANVRANDLSEPCPELTLNTDLWQFARLNGWTSVLPSRLSSELLQALTRAMISLTDDPGLTDETDGRYEVEQAMAIQLTDLLQLAVLTAKQQASGQERIHPWTGLLQQSFTVVRNAYALEVARRLVGVGRNHDDDLVLELRVLYETHWPRPSRLLKLEDRLRVLA